MIWFIAWSVVTVLLLTNTATALQFNSTGWEYIKLDHAFDITWISSEPASDAHSVTLQLFVYSDTQNYQNPVLTIGSDLTVNPFWWTPTRDQLGPQYIIRGTDDKGETALSPNFLVGIAPTSSSSVANPISRQADILTAQTLPLTTSATTMAPTGTITSMTSSPLAGTPGATVVQKASSASVNSPASAAPTETPMKNPNGLSDAALSTICIAAVLVFFLFIGIVSALFYHHGKKAALKRRSSRWPSDSSYSTLPDKPELGLGRMLPAEMGSELSVPKPAELEVPRTTSELEGHRMSKLVETGWGRRAELEWKRKSGWI